MSWNPQQYLKYDRHRLRPALDLLAQIGVAEPRRIVDLGCGTGNVTRLIAEKWPAAEVLGVDLDAAMLERARRDHPSMQWQLADVGNWSADTAPDLLFSNAALHWLGDHGELMPRLFRQLASGGELAVQMPVNFQAPSHRLLRETAADGPWAAALRDALPNDPVAPAEQYYDWLTSAGAAVDLWETEYLQVLGGEDPVLEWMRGTALVPVKAALGDTLWMEFCTAFAARLREAYPRRADGNTLFPFRRLFFIARR